MIQVNGTSGIASIYKSNFSNDSTAGYVVSIINDISKEEIFSSDLDSLIVLDNSMITRFNINSFNVLGFYTMQIIDNEDDSIKYVERIQVQYQYIDKNRIDTEEIKYSTFDDSTEDIIIGDI